MKGTAEMVALNELAPTTVFVSSTTVAGTHTRGLVARAGRPRRWAAL